MSVPILYTAEEKSLFLDATQKHCNEQGAENTLMPIAGMLFAKPYISLATIHNFIDEEYFDTQQGSLIKQRFTDIFDISLENLKSHQVRPRLCPNTIRGPHTFAFIGGFAKGLASSIATQQQEENSKYPELMPKSHMLYEADIMQAMSTLSSQVSARNATLYTEDIPPVILEAHFKPLIKACRNKGNTEEAERLENLQYLALEIIMESVERGSRYKEPVVHDQRGRG